MCCHFLVKIPFWLVKRIPLWHDQSEALSYLGSVTHRYCHWNFCAGSSGIILREKQWWGYKLSSGGSRGGAWGTWAPPNYSETKLRPKRIFWRPLPPHPPPPFIWRSGSTTAVSCFVMLEFSEFLHCRCDASISYCILLIKQLGTYIFTSLNKKWLGAY